MKRSHVWTVLVFVTLALAIFIPRLPELDRYVTPDEPKWLMRSGNFYMALSQGNLRDTYQHEHPGVTITWAGMLSFLRNYPNYVDIRPGQIERPEKLFIFLRNHVISPLRLLETGRQVVVVLIGLTLLLGSLVAWRLLGLAAAITGFLLIALDPFYVALSRLLHVDGLMSALMLLSILAFCTYLERGRNAFYLLLSAAAAGLSWLTKSPAFFLIPFLGLVTLVQPLLIHRGQIGKNIEYSTPRLGWVWVLSALKTMIVWGVVAGLVFVLFWPAMWVDPLGTLGYVFSEAKAYAIEGHENATFFNGQIHSVGESVWYFYPVSYLWRATPITLAGVLLALIGLFAPRRVGVQQVQQRVVLVMVTFAVLFTIFMSVGAKKFDRYLLPVHITLDLVAGIGWVAGITALIGRYTTRESSHRDWITTGALGMVVGLQLIGVLRTFPYYFNYYNPLLGGERSALKVMMVGWGEGLDQAAEYLNSLPAAKDLEVVAWYGDGPLSYLFDGRTISMDVNDKMEFLEKTDYVVLYLNQWQRQLPSQEVLDTFDRLEPAFTGRIGDLEYARVYRMDQGNPP